MFYKRMLTTNQKYKVKIIPKKKEIILKKKSIKINVIECKGHQQAH
jgi:hypothetical protein